MPRAAKQFLGRAGDRHLEQQTLAVRASSPRASSPWLDVDHAVDLAAAQQLEREPARHPSGASPGPEVALHHVADPGGPEEADLVVPARGARVVGVRRCGEEPACERRLVDGDR